MYSITGLSSVVGSINGCMFMALMTFDDEAMRTSATTQRANFQDQSALATDILEFGTSSSRIPRFVPCPPMQNVYLQPEMCRLSGEVNQFEGLKLLACRPTFDHARSKPSLAQRSKTSYEFFLTVLYVA